MIDRNAAIKTAIDYLAFGYLAWLLGVWAGLLLGFAGAFLLSYVETNK